MIYPFLYKILDTINNDDLISTMVKKNIKHTVWDDWTLEEIESEFIYNYVLKKFTGLKIFKNKIFLSVGQNCNFHIDRYHYHHLLHRILIPLNNANYQYEWVTQNGIEVFKPASGQVILFNNMIPHRFISASATENTRSVLYLDLIDPELEPYLKHFNENYSEKNGLLAKQYESL